MTEEQRYQQKIKIEAERNKCLKGIWDELKDIRQALTAIALGEAVKIGTVTPRVSILHGLDSLMAQQEETEMNDEQAPEKEEV